MKMKRYLAFVIIVVMVLTVTFPVSVKAENTKVDNKPLEDIEDEKPLKAGDYFRDVYWYSNGEACQIESLDLEGLELEMI